jgi:hypothetical protein
MNIKRDRLLLRESNKLTGFVRQNTVLLVLPSVVWQNRNNFLLTEKSRLA